MRVVQIADSATIDGQTSAEIYLSNEELKVLELISRYPTEIAGVVAQRTPRNILESAGGILAIDNVITVINSSIENSNHMRYQIGTTQGMSPRPGARAVMPNVQFRLNPGDVVRAFDDPSPGDTQEEEPYDNDGESFGR